MLAGPDDPLGLFIVSRSDEVRQVLDEDGTPVLAFYTDMFGMPSMLKYHQILKGMPLSYNITLPRGNCVMDSALACCAGSPDSIPAVDKSKVTIFRWFFLPLGIRW